MKKYLIALALLAAPTFATTFPSGTPADAEVGKSFTREIKETFGVQRVQTAVMDRTPESKLDFYYIEVEGMPCMVYFRSGSQNGISCDWSRWKGKTFDEEQAIKKASVARPKVFDKFEQKETRPFYEW